MFPTGGEGSAIMEGPPQKHTKKVLHANCPDIDAWDHHHFVVVVVVVVISITRHSGRAVK